MRFINDSTNKYYDLEKYNNALEQLFTAKKEIISLNLFMIKFYLILKKIYNIYIK